MVAHHAIFEKEVVNSYLKGPSEFVLTSIRLPLQRQLSWFRQQNRHAENPSANASSPECAPRNDTLLSYFDTHWKPTKFSASQWFSLQERSTRLAEGYATNLTAVVAPFDFIIVKERLRESYECLCAREGIRLCTAENPVRAANVKASDSCVEKQLLQYRAEDLMKGAANDLRLYEYANDFVTRCQAGGIPPACRCVDAAQAL